MGLELLEERYQEFITANPECIVRLKELADHNSLIQLSMRALLDDITAELCSACTAPCCQCMPIEGWFTEADYFIFRSCYDAPFSLRVDHGLPNGCAFLDCTGCVLPSDCRPFPCVKVNCKVLSKHLERIGTQDQFSRLYEALDTLQEQLWYVIHPDSRPDDPAGPDPS